VPRTPDHVAARSAENTTMSIGQSRLLSVRRRRADSADLGFDDQHVVIGIVGGVLAGPRAEQHDLGAGRDRFLEPTGDLLDDLSLRHAVYGNPAFGRLRERDARARHLKRRAARR